MMIMFVQDDEEDLSDLNISSEEDLGLGLTNSSLNASKFLKKSHSQTLTSDTAKQGKLMLHFINIHEPVMPILFIGAISLKR